MTRRMKTALCVLLIAAILSATAVVLLSGSGNGYETVFRAGVKSLTDTKSVAVSGRVTGFVNGGKKLDVELYSKMNGSDTYELEIDHIDNEAASEAYVFEGKRYINIDHENKTYQSYDTGMDSFTFVPFTAGSDEDDGTDTIIKIVKLFADFSMGSAKNQFVREPVSGGNRYEITLKQQQLPDLAKLFLELINETDLITGASDGYFSVQYMDFDELLKKEHFERCGKEMDERVFDLYHENRYLCDAYYEFEREVRQKYTDIGKQAYENGCIFVETDGTYEVYPSRKEMYIQRLSEGKPLKENMSPLDFPKNANIHFVHGKFDVSDEGYITRINLTGKGSIQDVAGTTYEGEIEILFTFDDYNKTHVDISALEGYTEKEEQKTPTKTVFYNETIEFLGKKYFVHYSEMVEE